jgi:hypothetical protein
LAASGVGDSVITGPTAAVTVTGATADITVTRAIVATATVTVIAATAAVGTAGVVGILGCFRYRFHGPTTAATNIIHHLSINSHPKATPSEGRIGVPACAKLGTAAPNGNCYRGRGHVSVAVLPAAR